MKTKITITLALMLTVTASALKAQTAESPYVKILPGTDKHLVKVLYAKNTESPITVSFFNADGVVGSDKIKGSYETGVMKTYDVHKIAGNEYWIEVSSKDVTARYRVVPTTDKSGFTAYLEKSSAVDSIVASKK